MESTALIQVRPEGNKAVIALYEEGCKLQRYAEARIIVADADVENATNDLSLIAKLKKAIEGERKGYVGPINDHLKAVNEAFKRFIEPLEIADKITRQQVLGYRAEQDRLRAKQEEINRLRMEAAEKEMALKGELTESVGLVEVRREQPEHYRAEMGTLGKMKVRKYRVVNFAELPDQYKIENSALLNKVVKAGIPSIPGVEIYEEETLRVTATK